MKELFLQYALPPILTALGAGAAWLLVRLGQWVSTKWADSKFANFVTRVTHFAAVVVQDIEATLRPQVEEALKDGQISDEEGKRLKAAAMEKLKAMLGEQGLKELGSVVGVFAPSIDSYLSGVIERQVAALPPR